MKLMTYYKTYLNKTVDSSVPVTNVVSNMLGSSVLTKNRQRSYCPQTDSKHILFTCIPTSKEEWHPPLMITIGRIALREEAEMSGGWVN